MLRFEKSKGITVVTVASLFAVAAPAFADDATSASTPSTSNSASASASANPSDLDQRVRVLERQLEIQQEKADASAKNSAVVTAGSDGFKIKSADGEYSLELHALVQADGRFYLQGENSTTSDQFLLRRVEPTLSGNLGKYVGFTITPEFGNSSATTPTSSAASPTSNLLDYYIDLRFDPAATLRVGRYKEPVGLENLQPSSAITFIERGLAIDLEPNRDIGAQLQGKLLNNTLSYAVGIFNGAADGGDAPQGNYDNHFDVAARLFVEPFRNSPGLFQGLGVGVAGTRGAADEPLSALSAELIASSGGKYVSTGQLPIFTYSSNVYAAGLRTHFSPQAYWYHNSFGLLTEYVTSTQTLSNSTTTTRLTHSAYQATASYVLTGDDASYTGVKPRHPFRIGSDGWGAFEIAARVSGLNIDSRVFDDKFAAPSAGGGVVAGAREYGAAANWYLNGNTKLSLNYEDSHFRNAPGATAAQTRPDERAVLLQAQIYY
ncbi:MAG: OprO/OprP family phosphate-selective porin [Stenotrophobium sp.]